MSQQLRPGQSIISAAYAGGAQVSRIYAGPALVYDSLPGFSGTWSQVGSDVDGEAAGDLSGAFVSMSADGQTVAIGAPHNDGNGTDSGHVRIYDWTGSAWSQRGADIDGEAAGDRAARVSMSSDGNTVAIGALHNDGNGISSGHVRVYDWIGSVWTQRGADIDGEAAGDVSGGSVSISSDGDTVAIGAPYNQGVGRYAGHVRIYDWTGLSWTQRGADIDGEAADDYSGQSVSISADGQTVAIGAPYNDGNGISSGHVRIYDWSGSAWTQRGSDIDGEAAGDTLGRAVALARNVDVVAAGAWYNDGAGGTITDSGSVRVYEWSGAAWIQRGADIDGEAPNDYSGNSVSISSDGNTVAVGVCINSRPTRIYRWNGSAWIKIGDIAGEAAYDENGISVSLSSDGNTVAIGAYYNDGNGISSGHVRIYSFS